ncbi:MAG: thioredoxin domain-containing protein [Thermoanaerobaculales bacterium]|jgi:thiol-disulfide isomerase/thioredoxin|nr:thioredoxin domain-containing protein [Thermoanaerobaculales bacterium]
MTGSTGLPRLLVIALSLVAATAGAADIRTVSHGDEVELTDHLVPGKLVLFDFYADWCGPCRGLEPRLAELAERHADRLALRKVDIVNWDSAVARQHRIGSIPHLVLYGPGGERLAAGDAGSVLGRLAAELGDDGPSRSGDRSVAAPLLGLAAIAAVALALLVRRRRPAAAPEPRSAAPLRPAPVDTAADPGDPAIWFVLLQGSLDGPFTRSQLAELARRGAIRRTAQVRRRGDADWSSLDRVLG